MNLALLYFKVTKCYAKQQLCQRNFVALKQILAANKKYVF